MEAAAVTLDDLAGEQAHAVQHGLRASGEVVWVPALKGWLILGRASAIEALRDSDTFTVDDERFSTAIVVGTSMLSTDGPAHARHRRPFVEPFLRPQVDSELGPRSATIADTIVSSLTAAGRAELRTELAGPLAVATILDVLNLQDADAEIVLEWYRVIVAGVDQVSTGRAIDAATHRAVDSLRACVAATLAAESGPLCAAAGDLTGQEIFSNAAVLMFGAIETNEGMTANALWHLLSDSALADQVRSDRSLIDALIEESLRLEPAAAVVDRYATSDTVLAGARINRGDFVRISLAAANRDPAVFQHPDRFEISRSNARQHLAFVQGPHVCLGLHLARAQTAAAIRAVLDRLLDIKLTDEVEAPTGLIFRKPNRLPATWPVG